MLSDREIIEWLAGIFEENPDSLTTETLRDDIPTWDSLSVLSIIAGLDEKFGINLSDREVAGMKKVGDVVDLIHAKAGKAQEPIS